MQMNELTLKRRLGAAGLHSMIFPGLAVVVAVIFYCLQVSNPAAGTRASQVISPQAAPRKSYFQNGQWLADARTLAAAFSYVFGPDGPPLENSAAPAGTVAITNLNAGALKAPPTTS